MANVTAVEGLTALGDPTRRTIFERIAERPRAVGELARELPVSRPAVSQHLKVLKDAGLVTDRAEGSRRIYRADPAGVAALRAQLLEASPGEGRAGRRARRQGGVMATPSAASREPPSIHPLRLSKESNTPDDR